MESRNGSLSRRAFTTGLGTVGALSLLPSAVPSAQASAPSAARGGSALWARRARDAYAALQRYLYVSDVGLYMENYPTQEGENPYSFVWPLREATGATQDVNQLAPAHKAYDDDVEDRFAALERYYVPERGAYGSYVPAPLGGGGDPFFDDNGVIGLEQIRRYRFTGDTAMLAKARRTFDFVTRAWDENGGMHWVEASWNPYQGATNVTSIASELAAHLYEATGEESYLEWAGKTYDWVYREMRRGAGIYANGLRLDGVVEETRWTYNSGFMIGAATLLGRATGDPSWAERAEEDFLGAMDYWTAGDRMYSQPAIFDAILFANLQLFCSEQPRHAQSVRGVIEEYAEKIYRSNRDAETGLFSFGASGGGLPDPAVRPQTLGHSAAIQVFSLLAWSRANFDDAT